MMQHVDHWFNVRVHTLVVVAVLLTHEPKETETI